MTSSRLVKSLGASDLALDDGEVDLDLVQPGGVHRGVHHDRGGELLGEPVDRGLAAVGGAVVDDPEHPVGGGVGLLGHDLFDEPVNGSMPVVSSQRPNTRARCTS